MPPLPGYFSFMCDHNTLGAWTTVSSIWHATSDSPVGPFAMSDMVAQPWSHNAMISRTPAGQLLLWQIGNAVTPPSRWSPCYEPNNTAPAAPLPMVRTPVCVLCVSCV